MQTRKTLTLALLGSLLLSTLAVASEDHITPEQKEQTYQALCVPGSEEKFTQKDKEEALRFRELFFDFLRDPAAYLAKIKEQEEKGGFMGSLSAAILASATCGAAEVLKTDIETRGCTDQFGHPVELKKALEICAPVLEKLK